MPENPAPSLAWRPVAGFSNALPYTLTTRKTGDRQRRHAQQWRAVPVALTQTGTGNAGPVYAQMVEGLPAFLPEGASPPGKQRGGRA